MVNVEFVKEIRPKLLMISAIWENFNRAHRPLLSIDLGKRLHKGQVRLSGEPYFETHCVWIASFMDRLVQNEAWTIGSLLHDVVEDQGRRWKRFSASSLGCLVSMWLIWLMASLR